MLMQIPMQLWGRLQAAALVASHPQHAHTSTDLAAQGSDAMVRHLLLMVVSAMRSAGMVTRQVETAEFMLRQGGYVSPSVIADIFRNVPRPCVVVVGEFAPGAPGFRR